MVFTLLRLYHSSEKMYSPCSPSAFESCKLQQLALREKGDLSDPWSDHYPLGSSEEASPEHGTYSMFAEKKFSTHQHHCHLGC